MAKRIYIITNSLQITQKFNDFADSHITTHIPDIQRKLRIVDI